MARCSTRAALAEVVPWVSWLLVLRLVNSLCVQTWFTADEYWQGPEVAHRLVFGTGALYVVGDVCLLRRHWLAERRV